MLGNPEYCSNMAGGCVVNRFRKEQRTRRVCPLFYDRFKKSPGVNHTAAGDGKYDGNSPGIPGRHFDSRILQSRKRGSRSEVTDYTRPPETRVAACRTHQFLRDRNPPVAAFHERTFNRGWHCGFATPHPFPNFVQTGSKRCHPSHTTDFCTHIPGPPDSKTMVALVPPKPNEFETTQRGATSRNAFATISISQCGSASR